MYKQITPKKLRNHTPRNTGKEDSRKTSSPSPAPHTNRLREKHERLNSEKLSGDLRLDTDEISSSIPSDNKSAHLPTEERSILIIDDDRLFKNYTESTRKMTESEDNDHESKGLLQTNG